MLRCSEPVVAKYRDEVYDATHRTMFNGQHAVALQLILEPVGSMAFIGHHILWPHFEISIIKVPFIELSCDTDEMVSSSSIADGHKANIVGMGQGGPQECYPFESIRRPQSSRG